MRHLIAAAFFLLPVVSASAQDDNETLIAGLDQVLYCATTFAALSVHPDAPEGAAAEYDTASTDLFTLAYTVMSEGGMEDDAITEVTDAYSEEVTGALQQGSDLRFTEEQCKEARDTAQE